MLMQFQTCFTMCKFMGCILFRFCLKLKNKIKDTMITLVSMLHIGLNHSLIQTSANFSTDSSKVTHLTFLVAKNGLLRPLNRIDLMFEKYEGSFLKFLFFFLLIIRMYFDQCVQFYFKNIILENVTEN